MPDIKTMTQELTEMSANIEESSLMVTTLR